MNIDKFKPAIVYTIYIAATPDKVWQALLITAVMFLPAATFFMWRGIRPYREEVERLEALRG